MKRIGVTGGAGQICYNLLFRIASGELFGNEEIALHILEIPQALDALNGVAMELDDCAFPQLKECVIGSDPHEVFAGVDLVFLVGAQPRTKGMERGDLLKKNAQIFVAQGKALNEVASPDVKVLVVGNPCNTNALITMHNAPKIPRENFFAMTRLDENRAKAQLAQRVECPVADVDQMTIWGNHSATQVPDFFNATIGGKPAAEVVGDPDWLEGEFITTVQKRGAAIIEARGKSSAASAANAAIDMAKSLITPSDWFSVGVISNGNPYGIQDDLIFSFPCRSKGNFEWEIIRDAELNDFLQERFDITEKELIAERKEVLNG